MFKTVSQEVFPFIKNLHGVENTAYSRHMKDAIFMIPTPSLLERVVEQISDVPMEAGIPTRAAATASALYL